MVIMAGSILSRSKYGAEMNTIKKGELQLADYLDEYHEQKGYLLSSHFNKNKKTGLKEIKCGDRTIPEMAV